MRTGFERLRWVTVTVLLGGSLLIASGCERSAETPPDPYPTQSPTPSPTISTPTPTPTTSPSPTAPSPTQSTPAPRPRPNLIEWILNLGVGSPPGPATDYFAAYEELRKQNCRSALAKADQPGDEAFTVVSAAAKACVAATEGGEKLWSDAKAVRDAIDPASLHCLDVAAFRALDQLVNAHDQYPERRFRLVAGGEKAKPPCPRITGITPEIGNAGDVVTIRGRHLRQVRRIDVVLDGVRTSLDPVGDNSALRVPMPAAEPGSTASIVIVADPGGWEMDSADFRYRNAAPSPTADSPSPTADSPGPTADSPGPTEGSGG
jgi:hypothetical protein